MKKKKSQTDAQSAADLLKKLQAAVLSSTHKREKQEEEPDSDELEFQRRIEGMLGRVTADTAKESKAPPKAKKTAKKKTTAPKSKKAKEKSPSFAESDEEKPSIKVNDAEPSVAEAEPIAAEKQLEESVTPIAKAAPVFATEEPPHAEEAAPMQEIDEPRAEKPEAEEPQASIKTETQTDTVTEALTETETVSAPDINQKIPLTEKDRSEKQENLPASPRNSEKPNGLTRTAPPQEQDLNAKTDQAKQSKGATFAAPPIPTVPQTPPPVPPSVQPHVQSHMRSEVEPSVAPVNSAPRVRRISAVIQPNSTNKERASAKTAAPTPNTSEYKDSMQKKDKASKQAAAPSEEVRAQETAAARKEEPIVVRPKSSAPAADPIVIKPRQSARATEPIRIENKTESVENASETASAASSHAPAPESCGASVRKHADARPTADTGASRVRPPRRKPPVHVHPEPDPPVEQEDPDLHEALDEVVAPDVIAEESSSVEKASPAEELPVEEPEVVNTPEKKNIFSRRREKKAKQEESALSAASIIEKKTGMTEDDIAMIFELGYENELGRLVGYETLKKLKYEHIRHHKTDRRIYRTSYGFRGTEYTGSQAKETVLAAYTHDKRILLVRLILSVLFALILIPIELPSFFGVSLAATARTYYPLFPAIAIALLMILSILHHRTLLSGLKSLFRFAPSPYSVNALLIPLTVIYSTVSLFMTLGGASATTPACACAALSLVLSDVCDAIRIMGELRAFRVASADGEKTVLDRTEPRKRKLRQGDKVVKIINDDIDQNLYRVRTSEATSGFFRRSNDFSAAARPFMIQLSLVLSLSFLAGIGGAIRTGTASGALSTAMTTLMFALPFGSFLLFFLPLAAANRYLYRRNCALIGEEAINEYSEEKTVIFEDSDMYTAQKCTQLSVRDGEDFRRDIRLAGALFRKMSGTLGAVGQNAPLKSQKEPSVAFLRMTDHGTEALVDNQYHLLAGDSEFMTRNGVRVPKETSDQILRRGKNVSLMYVAIDGALKLGYEIEYSVDQRFEDLVYLLAVADTTTAIRTYDPNLNEAFLRSSRPDGAIYVRVLKPGRYDQNSILEVSDTGAVVLGNQFDIALPLLAAATVRRVRRVGLRWQVICSMLASVTSAAVCILLGTYLTGWAIFLPLLYQSVLLASLGIYTGIKLQREIE